MKKRTIVLTSLLLVVTMLLTLCGCSSYRGIKAAFEKEGYAENEDFGSYEQNIKNALGDGFEDVCTVHLLTKGFNAAIIFEFNSTDEMNEQIAASETLKGLIGDAQKSDYVSGNCVLFYTPLTPSEIVEIFKSTK